MSLSGVDSHCRLGAGIDSCERLTDVDALRRLRFASARVLRKTVRKLWQSGQHCSPPIYFHYTLMTRVCGGGGRGQVDVLGREVYWSCLCSRWKAIKPRCTSLKQGGKKKCLLHNSYTTFSTIAPLHRICTPGLITFPIKQRERNIFYSKRKKGVPQLRRHSISQNGYGEIIEHKHRQGRCKQSLGFEHCIEGIA